MAKRGRAACVIQNSADRKARIIRHRAVAHVKRRLIPDTAATLAKPGRVAAERGVHDIGCSRRVENTASGGQIACRIAAQRAPLEVERAAVVEDSTAWA